jgi:hypothetical protein
VSSVGVKGMAHAPRAVLAKIRVGRSKLRSRIKVFLQ